MNQQRDAVLKEILKSPECYDRSRKNRGRLKLEFVNEQLLIAKEVIFFDEVYFPHLARLTKRAKAWGIFKTDWQTMSVGYGTLIVVDYPVEHLYQDVIGNELHDVLEKVWYGVEWSWAEPTVEECISLIDIAENYPLVQKALW